MRINGDANKVSNEWGVREQAKGGIKSKERADGRSGMNGKASGRMQGKKGGRPAAENISETGKRK